MTTTTYGYRLPDSGDLSRGTNGWFESYEFNVSRFDSHDHDGVNSSVLSLVNFPVYSSSILAANWTADGVGYKQTITTPVAITEVNEHNLKFVFTAPGGQTGEIAYLGYDRLTATTFEVYCNDNTAAFTVYYR